MNNLNQLISKVLVYFLTIINKMVLLTVLVAVLNGERFWRDGSTVSLVLSWLGDLPLSKVDDIIYHNFEWLVLIFLIICLNLIFLNFLPCLGSCDEIRRIDLLTDGLVVSISISNQRLIFRSLFLLQGIVIPTIELIFFELDIFWKLTKVFKVLLNDLYGFFILDI